MTPNSLKTTTNRGFFWAVAAAAMFALPTFADEPATGSFAGPMAENLSGNHGECLPQARVARISESFRIDSKKILEDAGVAGGMVVVVGCGDGRLTAALGQVSESYLVQGLDTDPAAVQKARRGLLDAGVNGRVSADQFDGKRLPYIDNLVNLVVSEDLGNVPMNEVLRVLCPEGVAYMKTGDSWAKTVKPRPADIDDWTHYMHDASGNAVAQDDVVGPPRRMQWLGSPRYSRHHDKMSSLSACVTGGGRIFYVFDEASPASILSPSAWSLIARDAFNGTILWKRPISTWHPHLWPLKSGPAQLPRRLVTDGERVYVTLGYDGPVSVLDAASGETVRVFDDTRGTEEIILHDGVLLALADPTAGQTLSGGSDKTKRAFGAKFWDEKPRRVVAVDVTGGKTLWDADTRVLPGTLAANSENVVFHDGDKIVCLDKTSGEQRWQSTDVPRAKEIRSFYLPILVLYDDVVLFSGGETAGLQTGSWYMDGEDSLTALSLADGKVIWTAYHPPSGYRSPEDLLVAGGLVWTGETTSGRAAGAFTGRNPLTGKVECEFEPDVDTYWFHHRCYRGKATENYLLMSRTGIEFIDIKSQHWDINHWVRGACLYGVMPANGLLYAPQHPCACYLESKQYGFNALAPAKAETGKRVVEDVSRLRKGPAYDLPLSASGSPLSDDWPTYRQNPGRSGRAATKVPTLLKAAWKTDIGGKLSSPVVFNNRLYVASVDTHTVMALDAETGEQLWQFTAGGRVDSPPTIHGHRVLFGSADGYVYCLRAIDGGLLWRFLAAPTDERLTSFEQVESVWPVHGSVLVEDGVAYFVAGRSIFLDGGLTLWRLDAASGKILSKTVLDKQTASEDPQQYVSWLNMPPALPDVLSSDGRLVYMRSQPFTKEGKRLPLEAMPIGADVDAGAPPAAQRADRAHLFSPTGFLDDTWWHRTYWMYGSSFVSGWCGYFKSGQTAPAGRILVCDDENVYGFGRKPQYYRGTTPIEHQLFSAQKISPGSDDPDNAQLKMSVVRVEKSSGKANPPGYIVKHHWTTDLPLFARAMLLSDGAIFSAGPKDVVNEETAFRNFYLAETQETLTEQVAHMSGERGAVLWVTEAASGEKLAELTLEACPVFDGMAAAQGRLYMTNQDGSIICLEGSE